MKTTITTLLLTLIVSVSLAQSKLPKTATITLTDKQILKLDSAINFAASTLDSKVQTKWFMEAFTPLYQQVGKQMVADTVKKKK